MNFYGKTQSFTAIFYLYWMVMVVVVVRKLALYFPISFFSFSVGRVSIKYWRRNNWGKVLLGFSVLGFLYVSLRKLLKSSPEYVILLKKSYTGVITTESLFEFLGIPKHMKVNGIFKFRSCISFYFPHFKWNYILCAAIREFHPGNDRRISISYCLLVGSFPCFPAL